MGRYLCCLLAILVACTSGDEDGDTAGAGESTGGDGANAGTGGGGGTVTPPSCSFNELDESCTEVAHEAVFSAVFACTSTQSFFTDQASWDAFFAACNGPINDPLEGYDWSRPLLLVPYTTYGCGGGGTVVGVRDCAGEIHVGASVSAGCCGCGDTTRTTAIAVDIPDGTHTPHTCGDSRCYDDPLGCG